MQILIRKANVIDKESVFNNKVVDILVEDGYIKEIADKISSNNAIIIDEPNLMVSQGWIDVFADYCEPGYEQKETIETGLLVAAAGGYTDVMIAPNTFPTVNSKSIIEFITAKAKNNIVNLHPLGAATHNIEGKEIAEMMDMRHSGAVAFTDGWKPIQNTGLALKVLEYIKAFKGVLIQIPNDITLALGGLMNEGLVSTRLGMPGIPALAESILLHRDIELLKYTGSKLHVTGISTAESVNMIKKAKADGLNITCSVTPFHLALTDEVLKTYNSLYKVIPPLRTEDDRLALIEGLNTGVIDCIATHHHPHEWDAKAKEFEYAAEGMAIQENAFSVAWNAVNSFISIDRFIEAITTVPRKIFGFENHVIGIGNKATLTIFTNQNKYLVKKENLKSKSCNNSFIGKEVCGKVYGIINNNQIYLNS